MRPHKIAIVVLLLAGVSGTGYVLLREKHEAQLQRSTTASAPTTGKGGELDRFLGSSSTPDFMRKDWKRFQESIHWATNEAQKSGLDLDQNQRAWVNASPEIASLPKEIKMIFAHPSIIWGRDQESGQWEAVLVLRDQAKKNFVLAHLTDALGKPKLEISPVTAGVSECLGFGPWHDVPVPPIEESWKAWASEPIRFLRWVGPGSAGLLELQFNSKAGIAIEVTNLEGDQNFGDFPFVISREAFAKAEIVGRFTRPKSKGQVEVWFKSQGQLFFAGDDQWNDWSKQIVRSNP